MRIILSILMCLLVGPAIAFNHGETAYTNVTMFHFDNNGSGWNSNETHLNTANVPSNLGLIATINVDDQVDAQPLLYNHFLYLVTENNTIYKINDVTGAVVTSRNFGSPFQPFAVNGCDIGGTDSGILSTPVIDTTTGILYLVANTQPSDVPTYTIYGIDVGTLDDRITPQVIAPTGNLIDNTQYTFSAAYEHQRASLSIGGNNIYVGFGSWCDFETANSRGWLLAFNKSTLALTVANGYLVNQYNPDSNDVAPFFLSSIWMSGSAPVIDSAGNVYVATGNTGYNGNTQISAAISNSTIPKSNLAESVIKFSPSLAVSDYFMVSNEAYLDSADNDVAAGGPILLPDLTGTYPHVILQPSKNTPWFFINRDNLGTYTGSPWEYSNVTANNDLYELFTSPVWGTGAYFIGPDDVLRVALPGVSNSGGPITSQYPLLSTYKVTESPGLSVTSDQNITLTSIEYGQLQGFPMTISSNGETTGSHIAWAVTRPTGTEPNTIPPTLYAIDPINNVTLFQYTLADFPNYNGNYTTSPIAANGKVYACSYKTCYIFGL